MKKIIEICGILLILFALNGCHPGIREDKTAFRALYRVRTSAYPSFKDSLDFNKLVESIDFSLDYFKKVPLDRQYRYGKDMYTAAHLIRSLDTFKNFIETRPSTQALQKFMADHYQVYAASGNQDKQVLFTGYFEPTYQGRTEKSEQFSYPLYSVPEDLLQIDPALFSDAYKGHRRLVARVDEDRKQVVPYYTRGQINSITEFYARARPLAWLESRVDRFFLEIQGSGRIDLGKGEILRVHYAGSNGNAYSSIGRYLIKKNEIPKQEMSMQAIRTWLEFHPQRVDEVLHQNESVVFFRKEQGGPFGSLGVNVTAFRSIATDSRIFPKGALCFLKTQLPDRVNINPLKQWEEASFFALNQDTGGAIKGPARADIFCGNDNYAGFTAGHMNIYGRLFFLVLKKD